MTVVSDGTFVEQIKALVEANRNGGSERELKKMARALYQEAEGNPIRMEEIKNLAHSLPFRNNSRVGLILYGISSIDLPTEDEVLDDWEEQGGKGVVRLPGGNYSTF